MYVTGATTDIDVALEEAPFRCSVRLLDPPGRTSGLLNMFIVVNVFAFYTESRRAGETSSW